MTHAVADNPTPATGGEDLAAIIGAYNALTDRMQASHQRLQDEVVRLREELASTNAQLQRSKRLSALGEMAAGIAHEVRNPLGAIQLYISMIIQDIEAIGPQPPQAELAVANARKVADAVRGLNAIVTDVLAFARETQPRPQTIYAATLLGRVVDAQRPSLTAAGVRLVTRIDEQVAAWCDRDLVHQALLNLVRNAIDAMAGTDAPVLTLAARASGEDAEIVVRDTGPGIAEADIDRIFNPFFTTRHTGTGLGLAIVHRIIDAHGGSISVHNDLARGGAIFRITLPRRPAACLQPGEGTLP